MAYRYTGNLSINNHTIVEREGDDLEELYTWLLAKAQGEFGDLEGSITDNSTGKVVKSFRKSPPD